MFRVLVADKLGKAGLDRIQSAGDVQADVKTGQNKAELLKIIGDYDAIIIRSTTKLDADLLAAARQLKVVGRAGVGVDNVDVKAATARGVIVMNTPEANAIAAAEQTMALMLAASRYTVQSHSLVKEGKWGRSAFTGIQLYRKKLGLIGFGRIARLVATRAQAFGMEVVAFDPYVSEEIGQEVGVTLVDLNELFEQADYISLHASKSPETERIVNADTLSRVKDGVILVNTARGALVDEAALASALKSGKVRAVGTDVYSQEPPTSDNPLIGLPNVVHTPHIGASTVEAQRDVSIKIVDQVLDALRGDDFRNSINVPFQAGPDYATVLPYMTLAEKIGALHFHMAPAPIRRVEVELRGDAIEDMTRPVAAALLKGLLESFLADAVNYVNAPVLAEEHGIAIAQSKGLSAADYANVIYCRAHWDDGDRVIAGVLFGGRQPRIVQVSHHHLDADPTGPLLIMLNKDVPGVIGQVGTILGAYEVNIGEWRMGRNKPGEEALSFINLDSEPPPAALDALKKVPAITKLKFLDL